MQLTNSNRAKTHGRGGQLQRWCLLALLACRQAPDTETRVLSVMAASSLTEAFQRMEGEFERAHPGVDVVSTFSGSQVLRLQLEQGARADVFASADEGHLLALQNAGIVSDPQTFAHGELILIVPEDNPAGLSRFADLPRASRLVLGSTNVPVGAYARQMLRRAEQRLGADFTRRVRESVVSRESNARLVRAKVELGAADAAIVYRSDVTATSAVRAIPIPEEYNVRVRYPIGVTSNSTHPTLARTFVAFVTSQRGRRLLVEQGFVARPP